MENKIRVNAGIVIEVNDAGDTIVVNVEDQCFVDKFYELIENLEKVSKYAESAAFAKLSDRDKVKAFIEKTKGIMEYIDALFGENACKKVFGDIVPNPYLIADFIYQLEPFVKDYANTRQKLIAERYNKNRRGGKKNV